MPQLNPFSLEPELEALMMRCVPNMESKWRGATPAEVARVEELAGTELPRCYRWLLLRLGRGWQSIAYPTLDFSVHRILEGHQRGQFPRREGMLCIADDVAPDQPQLRYYDIAHAQNDDAPVFMAGPEEDDFEVEFDGLRQMVGWSVFNNHRLNVLPFRCEGRFSARDEPDAIERFHALLVDELGFEAVIPKSAHCQLYVEPERACSSHAWLQLDLSAVRDGQK